MNALSRLRATTSALGRQTISLEDSKTAIAFLSAKNENRRQRFVGKFSKAKRMLPLTG
jgi:hypothetical protein